MKTWSFLIVALLVASTAMAAEVSLSYGTGDGQVAFMNATTHPKVELLNPLGPLAFRVSGTDFYVLDSIGGRVLQVGADGKVAATIKILEKPDPENILEDLALVRDSAGKVQSFLVIASKDQEILQVGLDGKLIRKVGGAGNSSGKFTQLQLVEAAPDGSFAAADLGRQVLALFNAEGKFVREFHWDWSGLCFDPSGNFCFLKWDATAKANFLVVESLDGKTTRGTKMEIGAHTNPRLWVVNKDGEALISYIPPEGFKGTFKVAACDAKGKPKSVKDLVPPVAMNRYLDSDAQENFSLISAHYGKAPEGAFKIMPCSVK